MAPDDDALGRQWWAPQPRLVPKRGCGPHRLCRKPL